MSDQRGDLADPFFERQELLRVLAILQTEPQAKLLGIERVVRRLHQFTLDGTTWLVGPIQMIDGKKHRIPRSVYERKRRLQQKGLHFDAYIWGSEEVDDIDPSLDRVVSDGTSLYIIDGDTPLPENVICLSDPLLIGLVRLQIDRWLYIKLGAWFHRHQAP